MIKIRKNIASDAMKIIIPSCAVGIGNGRVRCASSRHHGGRCDSAGWARSHSGRRPQIGGTRSKLCSGGGDVVAHSRLHAPQGLSPAGAPRRRLRTTSTIQTSTDSASTYEPIVEIRLNRPQYGRSG